MRLIPNRLFGSLSKWKEGGTDCGLDVSGKQGDREQPGRGWPGGISFWNTDEPNTHSFPGLGFQPG